MSKANANALSLGHGDDLDDFRLEDALDDFTTKRRKYDFLLFKTEARKKRLICSYLVGLCADGGGGGGYKMLPSFPDQIPFPCLSTAKVSISPAKSVSNLCAVMPGSNSHCCRIILTFQ